MTTAEIKGYIHDNAIDVFNCAARKSPLVLSGLFLELTRQFYSDEENLLKGVERYDPSGECSICIDKIMNFAHIIISHFLLPQIRVLSRVCQDGWPVVYTV